MEALCYLHGKAVVHKDLRVSAMHMRGFQFVIRELKELSQDILSFFFLAAYKIIFKLKET